MKKLKYIGILFLLILFSCVDDESRYGDIDIDEIKIEGIKDYQEIEVGGKLTITPVVTTKFGRTAAGQADALCLLCGDVPFRSV